MHLTDHTLNNLVFLLFLSQVISALLLGVALATGWGQDILHRDLFIVAFVISCANCVLLGRKRFR